MLFQGSLLQRAIATDKLRLGWLVADRKNPVPGCLRVPDSPAGERAIQVTNFQETLSDDTKLTLGAFLSQALSLSFQPGSGVSLEVSADESAIDILPDAEVDAWYRTLCTRSKTRTWLQNKIVSGKQTSLVVAIHTLQNAKVKVTQRQTYGVGAAITVPLGALLGLPGILDTAIDPGLSALREVERKASLGFEAQSLIYAVAYRRITIGWLSSKTVDKATLNPATQWMYSLKRGGTTANVDDIIDAKLETETETGDEDNGDNGTVATFDVGSGNQIQLHVH
ncbi:hypothetical protein B0T19DRAFT_425430 [Cercophora scortea]|uniref:Uncharacterized protein n=1 Tax=Cercophora scortea TaxID=314031 RepID=A0AAE0M8H5_9PEZI|nr:hypothetical protein B0T19DRAFT_425430 [Cercophora scortea]